MEANSRRVKAKTGHPQTFPQDWTGDMTLLLSNGDRFVGRIELGRIQPYGVWENGGRDCTLLSHDSSVPNSFEGRIHGDIYDGTFVFPGRLKCTGQFQRHQACGAVTVEMASGYTYTATMEGTPLSTIVRNARLHCRNTVQNIKRLFVDDAAPIPDDTDGSILRMLEALESRLERQSALTDAPEDISRPR